MERLFRTLIIISYATYVLWFFQPYYSSFLYTDEIRNLLDSDGYGGIDILLKYSIELGWLFIFAYLIAAVGLFYYISAARVLFTFLYGTSIFLPIVFGVSVQSNIDALLNNIIAMADAIILYMCYLSSISSKFTPHNKAFKRDAKQHAPLN